MSSGCGDVLSLADLQTAKKHQIFEAEVITGKSGGVATGADIDYATNAVTGQTQKTLPAVLRYAGFSPVSWDFSTGGTLTVNGRDKVVYDPVSKTWYSYAGALPVTVPAGFNPVGNADWKPQTDPDLRNELTSTSGASLVGGSVYVVDTFESAKLVENVNSKTLRTLGHHTEGKGPAEYVKTGTTGTPSSGTEALFYDATGHGWRLKTDSVDYYMFGAELDGATDDTLPVVAAHTYANANKIPIVQNGGNAFVTPNDSSRQIVFNTDAAFTGGFKFSSNSITGRGFVVRSVADEITLSQSDVVISEFVATRMKIPSLSGYANCYAAIQSTETDLNRKRDTGPALQLKRQPVVIGKDGTLDAPLWTTFSSISAIKIQSILLPTITIDGFRLRSEGALTNANPFGVQRNNVVIKNFYYEKGTTSATIPVQSLLSVEFCYNVTIEGISCDPLSVGIVDYNYVINTWTSSKISIRNMTSFDGWAQLDGNYCRNVSISDSIIDRVGSHFRCYDYTFKNLTARRGRCIAVSGGGLLHVENIKVYAESSTVSDEQYTVVALRGDYGAEWDGAVVVKNVIFDFSNFYSSSTGITASIVSAFIDSTVGAHDFMRTVVMPKSISIKDCTFIINTMPGSYLRALGVGCTSAIVSSVIYPSNIDIENITCDNSSGTNKFKVRGVEWNTLQRSEIRRHDVNIRVKGVVNIDPATYGETILDDANSTNTILTTGTNTRIYMTVRDCPWQSLRAEGNYIRTKVYGGSITYFTGTAGTSNRISFYGTEFNGTRFRGAIKVTIQDCIFNNYVDYTSASVPIGNGQSVDTNTTFIIGTATEFGATITGTVVTASTAKTGYSQSGYFQ
ncbi:hypothetical protein [Escherichia phage ST20]|nr:hypothetical protein [Escherichia phage ST20]